MKSNFELLIAKRSAVGVCDDNPYMFAIPNTVDAYTIGPATVHKYAKLSGAQMIDLLTSTNLRKHVATMSQLLNLSHNDMEQLATYMGHSLDIYKEYYRLPENTLQVAKVRKLLLLIERGKVNCIDSSTLEKIKLDEPIDHEDKLNHIEDQEDDSDIDDPHPIGNLTNAESISDVVDLNVSLPNDAVSNEEGMPNKQTKGEKEGNGEDKIAHKRIKTCVKRPWSEEEKAAVRRHFQRHILIKKVPNKSECDNCIKAEPTLCNRTWSHVKFFVKNSFSK